MQYISKTYTGMNLNFKMEG